MYQTFMFMWRHFGQVVLGGVVAWAVARGFDVSPEMKTAVGVAVAAAGLWLYGVIAHFLETRTGDSVIAKACRAIARLMMAGAPPVLAYKKPDERVRLQPPTGAYR